MSVVHAPTPLIRLAKVVTWPDMLRLKPVWDRLIAGDDDRLLLGHDWHVQSWKAYPENRKAEILVCRDQGKVQGILPLRRSTRGGVRYLNFFNDHQSPRVDLIAEPEAIEPMLWLIGRQLQRRRDWDVVHLARLRAATAEKVLRIWAEIGIPMHVRGTLRQRYVPLDRPWPEVVAGFKPALVKKLLRRETRLREAGPLEVRLHTGVEGLLPLLHQCFRIEASGWKGREGTAIQQVQTMERFYRQLAFRMARQNRLRIYSLWLGEQMLAFQYGITDGCRLISLKVGYFEPFQQYSPGQILRWHVMRLAREEGLKRFDFAGVDQPHQAEWTRFTEGLANLRGYNHTLRGQAMALRSDLWHGWKARHEPKPLAESPVRADKVRHP